MASPIASSGSRLGGGAARDALVALLLAALGWLAPSLAVRSAKTALLDFGPGDEEAVRGFRPDWERDGAIRFRWTLLASNVSLPLHASGEDFKLRLRMRRHLVEPAQVKLYVEGRSIASFEIQADSLTPYRIGEFPLPPLEGRHPFVLSIESSSASTRPLGIALDWLEIERGRRGAFRLIPRAPLALGAFVVVCFLAPRLAGLGRLASGGLAASALLAATYGAWLDPIAADRIARFGIAPLAAAALLALAAVRLRGLRRLLRVEDDRDAGLLVALVLLGLIVRCAVLLHPRYFYPDVRIHGLFALILARRGFGTFLAEFIPNQFRYSLGLQEVGGHWYAFPYPPAFYAVAAPLVSLLHYRGDAAVSITAATVNSLEVLLGFAIARHLGLPRAVAGAGAAVLTLLPLFMTRLSLAYFPALVGHALDAAVVLFLAARYSSLPSRAGVAILAGLLSLSMLTYTQGLLNFGTLLGLFLLLELAGDRSREGRRRQLALAGAALAAGLLSLGLFYYRYVPMVTALARGEAVPEEQIVLDIQARTRVPEGETAVEETDPYAGPDLDLVRGMRKAGWRLWVFYGPFAPLVVLGVLLLVPALEGYRRRLVIAWAGTYVLLNLASGGLPGPNLVRYNKDLEIVAPLCAMGLAWLLYRAWSSRRLPLRVVALLGAFAWVVFVAGRAYAALAERLAPLD